MFANLATKFAGTLFKNLKRQQLNLIAASIVGATLAITGQAACDPENHKAAGVKFEAAKVATGSFVNNNQDKARKYLKVVRDKSGKYVHGAVTATRNMVKDGSTGVKRKFEEVVTGTTTLIGKPINSINDRIHIRARITLANAETFRASKALTTHMNLGENHSSFQNPDEFHEKLDELMTNLTASLAAANALIVPETGQSAGKPTTEEGKSADMSSEAMETATEEGKSAGEPTTEKGKSDDMSSAAVEPTTETGQSETPQKVTELPYGVIGEANVNPYTDARNKRKLHEGVFPGAVGTCTPGR